MTTQIYEDHWDLSLAWTDFNGEKFLGTLRTVVNFIDEKQPTEYSQEYYKNLQVKLINSLGLNDASVRKGINEFVKLGFINCKLLSYPSLTKEYINAKTDEERKLIFSQIVYSNSSFQRSVTEDSSIREINFIVKSIEAMREFPSSLIPALITLKISDFPEGFVTRQILDEKIKEPEIQAFAERKYNQIGYMINLLKKLDGIFYNENSKTFILSEESEQIETPKLKECRGRDSYLQRLYKDKLQRESLQSLGAVKCMVEELSYPLMIASHIKPFKDCNESEAYDSNNGLLLSKNIDALFDKYYISFDDTGKIIFYNRVPKDIQQAWRNYKIVPIFMNETRKKYLKLHRELCIANN